MPPRTSKLALAGFISALSGIIVPVLGVIGVALGLSAVSRIRASKEPLKGKGLAIAGIMIGLISAVGFQFCYRAMKSPSNSMAPLINVNEGFIVDRKAYIVGTPKRGDIIVFAAEQNARKVLLCKRLVGLPNETVEIRDGGIYINGALTQVPHLPANDSYANAGNFGGLGQVIAIPEDSFYVLGDDPANSLDSRSSGFISRKDLYGKVLWTYAGLPPLEKIFGLMFTPWWLQNPSSFRNPASPRDPVPLPSPAS